MISIYLSYEFTHKRYRCFCKSCHFCIYGLFVHKIITKKKRRNNYKIIENHNNLKLKFIINGNDELLSQYKTPETYEDCPKCLYKYKRYFERSLLKQYKCQCCGYDFKSEIGLNDIHENNNENLEAFAVDELYNLLSLIRSKSRTTTHKQCCHGTKCESVQRILLISRIYCNYCENQFKQVRSTELEFRYLMEMMLQSRNISKSFCWSTSNASYTMTDLSDDSIHVIKYHKNDIKNECNFKDKCVSFVRHTRNRNNDDLKNREYCKTYFYTSDEKEIYFQSVLDKIHYFIYHQTDEYQVIYNMNDTLKWQNTMDNSNNDNVINDSPSKHGELPSEYIFSKPFNYLHPEMLPKNACFRDELNIMDKTWELELKSAKISLLSHESKNSLMNTNDDFYGICFGDKIGIEHILAVQFYCGFSYICYHFRESFRRKERFHYENYYFFGRFLYEAVQFNGCRLNETLYLGIKQRTIFESFQPCFGQPTSTTTEFHIASAFAADFVNNEFGIILELESQFKSSASKLETRYYSCSWLSKYPEEEECLLFGFDNTILIKNIYIWIKVECKWQSMRFEINALNYWQKISTGYAGIDSYNVDMTKRKRMQHFLAELIEFELDECLTIDDVATDSLKYIHQLFHFMLITKTGSQSNQMYSIRNREEILLDVDFRNITQEKIIKRLKKYIFNHQHAAVSKHKIAKLYPNITQFADQNGEWVVIQTD